MSAPCEVRFTLPQTYADVYDRLCKSFCMNRRDLLIWLLSPHEQAMRNADATAHIKHVTIDTRETSISEKPEMPYHPSKPVHPLAKKEINLDNFMQSEPTIDPNAELKQEYQTLILSISHDTQAQREGRLTDEGYAALVQDVKRVNHLAEQLGLPSPVSSKPITTK